MTTQANSTAATDTTNAANANTLLTQNDNQTQTQTQQQTTQQQTPGGEGSGNTQASVALFDPSKVKLPDGFTMDESLMKEFSPFATEKKFSHDDGQKIVDFYVKGLQSVTQRIEENSKKEADAQVKQWESDSKVDPEIGGAKFNENLAIAGKAIARFGTPALKTLLDETGLGNHPEFIRAFYKAGKLISEDGLGARTEAPAVKKSDADIMYPNHGKTAVTA